MTVLQKPSVFADDSDDEVCILLGSYELGNIICLLVFITHNMLYRYLHSFGKQLDFCKMYIQVSAGIFADSCPNTLNMFCFSDLRWGESAKRSYQKEDDEAGERKKLKDFTYEQSFLMVLNYYLFCFVERHVWRCRRPWSRTALCMTTMLYMMIFKIRDWRTAKKFCRALTKRQSGLR